MSEPLANLGQHADHSWLEQLRPDPETEKYSPNKTSRQVHSGHYVLVRPTPLPKPRLIIHSPSVARALGITSEEIYADAFVAFYSGDQSRVSKLESWCTPYALSIMGQEVYHNCPFGNGNGYGDGRAISIGEVVVDGRRWEMQLKGAGTTPFCRGADGRAVLRSSIREFLASEAMHHLGVETTRALSLVVSGAETARRPWYSGRMDGQEWTKDPDTMVVEPCAIATRVAPSFLRVGHLDLFARRVFGEGATEVQHLEHQQIVQHAIFREYGDLAIGMPLADRAAAMLEAAADRLGMLVAGWLRVGFCQGNFNADNCLIGGRTMDYGPFGWIEKYDPAFTKWIGSGAHFAFMNQPRAAIANYYTFVSAVMPVLGDSAEARKARAQPIFDAGAKRIQSAAVLTIHSKMGTSRPGSAPIADLWKGLEPLMRRSEVDYTIFWRQLADIVDLAADPRQTSDDALLAAVAVAFYEEPTVALAVDWCSWLRRWLEVLAAEGDGWEIVAKRLRVTNPKYVPREWMLVEAYEKASHGDYTAVHELYRLFLKPYDEQPEFELKYYRRTPPEMLSKGGCAFMS